MTLGEKIRFLREEDGLSRRQLASEIYVSPLLISLWEQGEEVPDMDIIAELSYYFDVPFDYLLTENNRIYDCLPLYKDAMLIEEDLKKEMRKSKMRKAIRDIGTAFIVLGLLGAFAFWVLSLVYPVESFILSNPGSADGGLPSEVTYTGFRAYLLEHDIVALFAVCCVIFVAGSVMRKSKPLLLLIPVAAVAITAALYFEKPFIQYTHPRVESFEYLYEPVQINTTGSTSIRIDGTDIDIEYIAEYIISGRVLGVKDYTGNRLQDRMMPRDVAIAWGWLTDTHVDSMIQWGPFGERSFSYKMLSPQSLYRYGGYEAIRDNVSNNHLIPDGDTTRQLIRDIKEEDFIRIEGYLVNATYSIGNRVSSWNSDTARNNNDCEVIFVTNITWLSNPNHYITIERRRRKPM